MILLPWRTMFEHGVENGEQLPHAGGESDLFRLARGAEALIEVPDDGIETSSCEGRHV